VLLASGRSEQLDEALLLVSELSTNGIVHAGTPVDVDVLADETGVTITVSDQKTGLVGNWGGARSGPFDLIPGGGDPLTDGMLLTDGIAEAAGRADLVAVPEPVWWDDTPELEERGRGLLLVDRLASSWGTSHHAAGKSVWFRLGPGPGPSVDVLTDAPAGTPVDDPADSVAVVERLLEPVPAPVPDPVLDPVPDSVPDPVLEVVAEPLPEPVPVPAAREAVTVPPAAWVWLVHVPEVLRSRLTMPQLVSELLERLCEVTGAASGSVWLDRGDSAGERRLAGYSAPHGPRPAPDAEADIVTVPLAVGHPLRGRVVLHPPAGHRPGRYWQELASLSAQRMAIAIDAERLEGDELRRRGWLTFLAEASELLANSLDLDLTTALVAQLAVPRLGTWGAVHLLTPRGGLRPVAVAHVDEQAAPGIRARLGEASTAAVRDRLAEVVTGGGTVPLAGDLAGVALPLVARGRVIGVLSVGRFAERAHGGEDVAMLADFARRASLAIDNAKAHAERIKVADELQEALRPPVLPTAPGVDFGAEFVPATSGADVGGDFYDVFPVRRNRWFASIGDVCGKGAQAAVVTGIVRDVMRVLVGDDRPTARMLASLNRTLLANGSDRYATVATAMVTRLETVGKSRVLEVALTLAGHDRPILVRADGATRAVGECGTAVGLVDQFDVSEVIVTLRQGESLVFVTDGVTERRDGIRMFGTKRLRQLLSQLAGSPAQVIATAVREEVVAFAADPPRDDIAVLVLRNPW
jgi:serine phosphatase RsbU (regulator of sigma subunit)